MPHVITHSERYHHDHPGTAVYMIANVLWYIFAIAEALLAFRFVLVLIGAGSNFIYALTNPLVRPFDGILGSVSLGRGVLDLDTLLAMLVYWLLAVVLTSLLKPRYTVVDDTFDDHVVDRRREDYQIRG